MRRFHTIFLLILLIPWLSSISCSVQKNQPHYRDFKDAVALRAAMKWHPERKPWVSAHRGNPLKGFPENAIETFEHALTYYPCLIECDVRLSKDGHLVMMHDETLDRTTTGKGAVNDYTLDQLKKLLLKDPAAKVTGFRIPTLDEVLTWTKGRAVLTLDVKRDVPFSRIIQAVRKHKAEGYVIIITYSLEDANTVHRLAPELMISATAGNMETLNLLLASGIPSENLCVFTGVSEPEPEVYDTLHRHGIRAILGTMHNLDNRAEVRGSGVYRKLYENGADILSTDNVPLVVKAIRGMKK